MVFIQNNDRVMTPDQYSPPLTDQQIETLTIRGYTHDTEIEAMERCCEWIKSSRAGMKSAYIRLGKQLKEVRTKLNSLKAKSD
jgi:hypothetical protein